jgi:hypothetical protein
VKSGSGIEALLIVPGFRFASSGLLIGGNGSNKPARKKRAAGTRLHLLVIAGLDPAIHAEWKLP